MNNAGRADHRASDSNDGRRARVAGAGSGTVPFVALGRGFLNIQDVSNHSHCRLPANRHHKTQGSRPDHPGSRQCCPERRKHFRHSRQYFPGSRRSCHTGFHKGLREWQQEEATNNNTEYTRAWYQMTRDSSEHTKESEKSSRNLNPEVNTSTPCNQNTTKQHQDQGNA